MSRLSAYYRILGELGRERAETIPSKRLAARAGVTPAQVRKDLSFFGNFGRRGLGYNVLQLREEIAAILGLGRRWRVALLGAGNLGHALFAYREFEKHGFFIEHVFDIDPNKVGTSWRGQEIAHISELPRRAADTGIDIAIVAVPAEAAQAVVDIAVGAGIRAVLNFAPAKVVVPDNVALREVDLSITLESLSYALVK